MLGAAWRDELRRYISGIVLRQGGLVHEIGAGPDHVRLLARLRAEPSVAAMLRLMKANSSKWINRRRFVEKGFGWAPGYHATTVSASRLDAVRGSVRNQDPPGSGFERRRRALLGDDGPPVMADTHHRLIYHVVFGTKHRQPLIDDSWQERLFAHVTALVEADGGTVIEINGMPDHVHLLARLKAEPSVAVILRHVKAGSSQWVNSQELQRERFEWQVGYGAFSVSRSQIERVRRYIRGQQEHHRRYSFDAEMKAFRRRHAGSQPRRGDIS